MKVNARKGTQIKYFFKMHHVLPVLHKFTGNRERYVEKDWRTITFRPDHVIQFKKNNHFIFMCQRANIGECQHAVCYKCHKKHSKAQKLSRGSVLSG